MEGITMKTRRIAWAAAAVLAAGLAVGSSGVAHASTAACDAVAPPGTCASWQSEVPNRPDLDVSGGALVSGTPIIVYTRSSTDKAEDFRIVPVNVATATSRYTVTGGAHSFTQGSTGAPVGSFSIEYDPKGVPSHLCISTVNPNGFADAQLRGCSNNSTVFNPFQTFTKDDTGVKGDGQFVKFIEVINGYVMTNPNNNGSIGTVGNRPHVSFRADHSFTGQLWGQNNQ